MSHSESALLLTCVCRRASRQALSLFTDPCVQNGLSRISRLTHHRAHRADAYPNGSRRHASLATGCLLASFFDPYTCYPYTNPRSGTCCRTSPDPILTLPLLCSWTSSRSLADLLRDQIWHGLGDRYDAPGLLALKADLESRPGFEGIFVHFVSVAEDGAADQ